MQEALNAFIEEAVLNSKALASTKADSKGRQGDVYNSVRKEIEYVLEPWLPAYPSPARALLQAHSQPLRNEWPECFNLSLDVS